MVSFARARQHVDVRVSAINESQIIWKWLLIPQQSSAIGFASESRLSVERRIYMRIYTVC